MKNKPFLLPILLLLLFTSCNGLTPSSSIQTDSRPAQLTDSAWTDLEMDQIEEKVKQDRQTAGYLFQKLNSQVNGLIKQFWCDDFDGDGSKEAFAYVSGVGHTLWFVSKQDIQCLHQDLSGALRLELLSPTCKKHEITKTAPIFFSSEWFISAHQTSSFLYMVEDGKAVPVFGINHLINFTQDDDDYGQFTAQYSAYDFTPNGEGHTWKDYWLYWDKRENRFFEYGALSITPEQFGQLTGAKEVLQSIAGQGGTVTGILIRKNGIVNINYQIVQNEQVQNWNVTLKYNFNFDRILERKENTGIYQAAVLPDMATYPSCFHDALYAHTLHRYFRDSDGYASYFYVSDLDGNGMPEIFVNSELVMPQAFTFTRGHMDYLADWSASLRAMYLVKDTPLVITTEKSDTVGASYYERHAVYQADASGFTLLHNYETQYSSALDGVVYIMDGGQVSKETFEAAKNDLFSPEKIQEIPFVKENPEDYVNQALARYW